MVFLGKTFQFFSLCALFMSLNLSSKTDPHRAGSLRSDMLDGSPAMVPAPWLSSSLPSVLGLGACIGSARATRSEGVLQVGMNLCVNRSLLMRLKLVGFLGCQLVITSHRACDLREYPGKFCW